MNTTFTCNHIGKHGHRCNETVTVAGETLRERIVKAMAQGWLPTFLRTGLCPEHFNRLLEAN